MSFHAAGSVRQKIFQAEGKQMTSKVSGICLCGSISFECDQAPEVEVNCHCDDCRRCGGVHTSFVLIPADVLRVTGRTKS